MRDRNVIPPEVSQPGSFNTIRYRTALTAYPFQVRAEISVRGRTRTGTIWFKKKFKPHGLRLSKFILRLTPTFELTSRPNSLRKKEHRLAVWWSDLFCLIRVIFK